MVDSPTPTVPMRSDSTKVISSSGPRLRASAAATVHPAVPPPAMTTRFTACPSKSSLPLDSPVQPVEQSRPQPPGPGPVDRREVTLRVLGQVRARPRRLAEDVVIEQRAPSLLLRVRAVAQAEQRVEQ